MFTTAISCIVYIVLIVISFILVIIFRPSNYDFVSTFISNIGYGVFASTLVAWIIDIATTIRQKSNDKRKFVAYSKYLRKSVDQFLFFRTSISRYLHGANNTTAYTDWIMSLNEFRNTNVQFGNQTCTISEAFMSILDTLLKSAERLNSYSIILADSKYVDDMYLRNMNVFIQILKRCCSVYLQDDVDRESFRHDFEKAVKYFDIILKENKYNGVSAGRFPPFRASLN